MRAHVTSTVRACFAILRQINFMRPSLTRPALTLLRALVIRKLDYCNSVLAGAPAVLLRSFQSVLNAAARLVFSANRSAHTTPLLQELHWLIRVPERIEFRLCTKSISAGTVDMPHNDRRSCFSGGRSSGLELSDAASPGCFVDRLISAGTENSPVFKVCSCCLTRYGDIVRWSCNMRQCHLNQINF